MFGDDGNKPGWRVFDETPKRTEDVRINVPGFRYEGSGRILTQLLLSISLFACSIGTAVVVVWHHREASEDHITLGDTILAATCINLLEPHEKRDFRNTGRYCGSIESAQKIRKKLAE